MLFRIISAINLVILALSIPFFSLSTLKDNESEELVVSIQFKVITGLDFILACAYTFYFILNISYTCYKGKTEKVLYFCTITESDVYLHMGYCVFSLNNFLPSVRTSINNYWKCNTSLYCSKLHWMYQYLLRYTRIIEQATLQ